MIQSMVVINMQNSNALISMAMVSQNDNNPFHAFCSYLEYCLYSNASESMTLSELRKSVGQEFGLYMPYNIVLRCVNILADKKSVKYSEHKIRRIGSFDTSEFDRVREKCRQTEKAIIDGLVHFVSRYERDWTTDYARTQLLYILDTNGLAYDIFMRKESVMRTAELSDQSPTDDQPDYFESFSDEESEDIDDEQEDAESLEPFIKDSFFAGKYIEQVLLSDTIEKTYLEEICEGLLICAGTYQLPNSSVPSTMPQIRGTNFFFDTKVLLRFLGCSGESAIEAVKELVKLIQDGGGRIYYFPQTFEEISIAFDKAIKSIENGFPPSNNEMRLFASKHNFDISVLRAKQANIKEELSRANIFRTNREEFSEQDRIRFGFSREDFQSFMNQSLPWDRRAIENDSWSIWETHMRRGGNYDDYCGTSSCLPVFVTTNSGLIRVSLDYRDDRKWVPSIHCWKQNRLPVITDTRLTCRLWSPASQGAQMSRLYLLANAVAAQRPTRRYIAKVRELAKQFEETVPEYSAIPLPSYFDDNITNAILECSKGDENKLDLGNFASSIQELTEWKAKEQEDTIHRTQEERDIISKEYNSQTRAIIDGAIDKNKNTRGLSRLWLFLISMWLRIAPPLFIGVSGLISLLANNWNIALGVIAIVAVFCIAEYFTKYFNKKLLHSALPIVKKKMANDIEKNLRLAEKPYKEEIIRASLERNVDLSACKEKLVKAIKN